MQLSKDLKIRFGIKKYEKLIPFFKRFSTFIVLGTNLSTNYMNFVQFLDHKILCYNYSCCTCSMTVSHLERLKTYFPMAIFSSVSLTTANHM